MSDQQLSEVEEAAGIIPASEDHRATTLAGIARATEECFCVKESDVLCQIVGLFEKTPQCLGVLVMDRDRFVNMISRRAISECLARRYARELFLNRPASHLLSHWGINALEMPESTDISHAIQAALARDGERRYEPLVVLPADGSRYLIDLHAVLLQQCGVLAGALARLERQSRELETAYREREQMHRNLLVASREAGRAEVATGILHNVGNVLNSVNVSATVVADRLRQSKVENLGKAAALFKDHQDDLPSFLTQDEKGRQLPGYLLKLSDVLAQEKNQILDEMATLAGSIEHIKQVVQMQQGYAKASAVVEPVPAADLMEDALRLNMVSCDRHHVQVVRQFESAPDVSTDRHKVLQILVNLISNAKNALKGNAPGRKQIVLRIQTIGAGGEDRVRFQVIDNGVGIAPDHLTRVFSHGFTTRKDGHGFGLHSAANAAREMAGSLTAASAGLGQGATFTLELPLQPIEVAQ